MIFPKESTLAWKFWYFVAIVIKPFFLRLTIEGKEHVPMEGGCIIACNHTMGPDYVILGYASPRQVYYMAKAEIFDYHPWLARIVSDVGAFPVHRGKGDSDAVERAIEVVQSGRVLGMFPEGTRSRTGALQPAKTGVARIALGAGASIVPAVVINSEPVLRDWLKFQRRPQVIMRFGPPLATSGDAKNPADVERVTNTMMNALAELLPVERRGGYGGGSRD